MSKQPYIAVPPKIKPNYTLWYNGQAIVSNCCYALCNGKKTALINAGTHYKHLLEIKRHD